MGLYSEGMDQTRSLRSMDEIPRRFKDYRVVPRIQIVDHVTSEPTTSYPWDSKTVLQYSINHCFVGVFHRHRYVIRVKVKKRMCVTSTTYSLSVTNFRIV